MANDRTRAGSRPPLRARVAAWLRNEAGDTMIEVTVAALLVALIAIATFTGYASVAHIASGQNTRAQASALAEADQARLHGLTLNNLSSSGASTSYATAIDGNTNYTTTVDKTVYTVTSSTKFVSGQGAAACTTGSTTTADEVQTTTVVSWNSQAYAGGPVELHGLVTPPQGGSLIVRVLDASQNGISGVTVSVSGPPSVSHLTTDANGCVEFGGLSGGSYTATATQNGTTATGSQTVVATQTKTINLTPAGGTGAISATFTTTYNGSSHASSADQVTAYSPPATPPLTVFGSASSLGHNTYLSTVSSGSVLAPGSYTTYAGSCAGDASDTNGYQLAAVTTGTTQSVSLPVPAMIVDVFGSGTTSTEYNDNGSSNIAYSGTWSYSGANFAPGGDYDADETWSDAQGSSATITFTGTSVQWLTSYASNHGYANVYLDGSLVASNVNSYGNPTTYQHVAYSASGLANTSHTLEILVDNTKSSSSSGTFVTVDAFVVGAPALLATAPVVTLTDNNTGCANQENYPLTQAPSPTAGALVDPGQPYGNWTVCASSVGEKNTATVANTSYTTGNVVNVYLASGSSGLTTGSCT